MQPSFVTFDKISQAKQIVPRCKPLCPLEHGLESLSFSLCPFYMIFKLVFLTETVWGLKIIEVEGNARPSGPAPFLKAHECVNHLEQMEV